MLPHLNLRPKVTAAVLAVSLAAMTAAVFMAHRAMRETVRAEYRRSAAAVARGLATAAKVPMAVGDKDELGRLASLSLQANGLVHVHFTDRAGRDLTHIETEGTDSDHDELISGVADVLTPQRGDEDLDQFDTPQTSDGAPMLRLGSVEVGIPAAVVDARMSALSGLFVRIVLGAGLVIGAIMWVLAGAWTRRLDRLVEASERIARGELDSPLADPSGDEIGRLTDAFSRMRLAVKQRDREARQFNETLQEQVRARTSDLEEAMHAAQAANRAKSDFLANMSHEIRTPMTAILGFAELLNDPGQTADAKRDCVSTISRSGKHLLTIINDILDISKIEAGKMTVEPIPCEPVAIIHDAVSLMRERAAEQGIELKTLFDSPIPQTISCDPLRLRQILLNLVGNAVKFTQQGSVTLHVTADPAAQTFTVAVQDTGIGIAPENAANLFRPFSQSDNTMTRRFGGTGLGLTIARRFAELLGGSLTFVSAPGKGSTFTVTVATGPLDGVPMVSGTASAKPAAPAPQTPGTQLHAVRILIAEDGPDNQRLLRHYLTKAGAEVAIVENGQLACEALAAARRDGRPFSLVLMDMQMPDMDGYTAAACARAAGDTTPIVALTAHALVGDRQRCIDAGCSDYLTKPVDRTALLHACRKWADTPIPRAAA